MHPWGRLLDVAQSCFLYSNWMNFWGKDTGPLVYLHKTLFSALGRETLTH